ncbi:MAG: TlpA family protein disulfide reductase [Pseudonocardiaceae bacterium]
MVDFSSLFGITYVLLWVLVISESVLMFVLLRTIGHLLLAEQPIAVREGVPVGRQLPDVEARTADGHRSLHSLLPGKPYTAVVFATPTCSYCPGAVKAVQQAVGELPWLGATVLVRAAELDGYAQIDEWGHVGMITSTAARKLNVNATPFVMIVDDTGKVIAKSVVNGAGHLSDLLATTEATMTNSDSRVHLAGTKRV